MENQDEHNKRIRKYFHELANNPDAKNQTAMQQLVNFLRKQRTIDLTEHWRIFSEDIEAAIQEFYMEIEKEQIIDELKLIGNYFDVSKLDAEEIKHHIRFTSIIQDRINHYEETYEK